MPHKRYKHCELDERPSQTLPKQYKHRKRHKNVHRQCPINTTNAVNARRVPL